MRGTRVKALKAKHGVSNPGRKFGGTVGRGQGRSYWIPSWIAANRRGFKSKRPLNYNPHRQMKASYRVRRAK